MNKIPCTLVAALACRNTGTRLYAKPLQRLGSQSILQHMISQLKALQERKDFQSIIPYDLKIVLGISEGVDNLVFQHIAQENKIGYIIGDEEDVQFRLLQCAHLAKADIILRLTTESPFTAWNYFPEALRTMTEGDWDLVTIRNLPDGSSFELIRHEALKRAHDQGNEKTRTELCTEYMFRHPQQFRIHILDPKPEHARRDYRLTVDYPEDLSVCRHVYTQLAEGENFPLFEKVVAYLDQHPELMQQLAWIDGNPGRSLFDRKGNT